MTKTMAKPLRWHQDPKRSAAVYANKRCDWCDKPLEGEELEAPVVRDDDEVLCDSCDDLWRSENCMECCMCCDEDESESMQAVGRYLVVFDAEEALPEGWANGIYEITRHPYFIQGLIGGGGLFENAATRVGPVPHGLSNDGYAVGHLCGNCTGKIHHRLAHGIPLDLAVSDQWGRPYFK